eukprot:COSAG02_NODE_115_length_35467_cov_292.837056_25_plen_222_part_00
MDGTKSPPRERGKMEKTRKDWEQDEGWSVTLHLKKDKSFEVGENTVLAPDGGLPLRYCFYEKKWLRSGRKTEECQWCNTKTCKDCKCPVISDARAATQYLSHIKQKEGEELRKAKRQRTDGGSPTRYGTVLGHNTASAAPSAFQLRSEAGKDTYVGWVHQGDRLEILGESHDNTWYKVRRTGGLSVGPGWLRGTHLDLDEPESSDEPGYQALLDCTLNNHE